MPKQTISLQIFERLFSASFTWSILECFASNDVGFRKPAFKGPKILFYALGNDVIKYFLAFQNSSVRQNLAGRLANTKSCRSKN